MKKKLFILSLSTLLSGVIMSCQRSQPDLDLMKASDFETLYEGRSVSLYTLRNKQGTTMQVTNYGARVVSLWCADRDDNWADIVLGFESIDRYINNMGERFLGAAIGRFGNRIADGKFMLNGSEYQLSTYNNGQCLHGGDVGFDKVVWSVDSLSDSAIYLSYLSKDMEEGFPGNLKVQMTYQLTDNNEFRIDYSATTDKDTPVNLTHHSFFNLKGEGQGSINDHVLTIAADRYTPVNASLIPFGHHAKVDGTPFDFREPKRIGESLDDVQFANDEQFANCKGYDHNFVINRKTDDRLEFAASVYEPTSGRYMEVWSTEPGLQFYGGNFFDGKTDGKRGDKLRFRESFALETQHFPDSPNHPNFPSTILTPDREYKHTCIYRFSTK